MSRRPYIRSVSDYSWWLSQPRYVRYMMREASCIFIGAYSGVLVFGLVCLSQGAAAWDAFLQILQAPGSIAFHLLALAFSLYHTTTWFNVTPKAMPIQLGETRVPGSIIIGAHYLVWIIVSVLTLLLVGV